MSVSWREDRLQKSCELCQMPRVKKQWKLQVSYFTYQEMLIRCYAADTDVFGILHYYYFLISLMWAVNHDDTYPPTLETVTSSKAYFPEGAPICPKGGVYTMDEYHKVRCSIHKDETHKAE